MSLSNSTPLKKDKLFLLQTDYADPAYPGRVFYCWHCLVIEGLLSSFPKLREKIDIEIVPWPRPRKNVVDLVGEENQSLPLLVLADGETSPYQTGTAKGHAIVNEKMAILKVLAERYGVPEAHP